MSAPGSETVLALTTSRPEPYEYQPLSTPDSIRVLCLEPAKTKDAPLRGYIIQYDRFAELAKVHSRRKYCAVSYVWGTPEFTEHLEITDPNRNGRSTILPITPGVKTMLQHFRKPDKKQHLWIDAICLNQSDQTEKATQIPMMGEIYAQAYKSKFWLGVEDGLKAAKVFAYFRCSASMPSSAKLKQNLPFSSHEEFEGQVRTLLRKTWFSRRWILQEARLSQNATMWCGDHSIPYHVFITACNNIAHGRYELENRLNNEYAVQSTHRINSLVRGESVTEDMSTLLWNFHESACSEENDRFGALYGLIPRDLQPELDLTAPYPRLFQQFAVNEVNNSSLSAHHLIVHLASFGSLNHSGQSGIPSWVPDWSRKRRVLRNEFYIHTFPHMWFATRPELDKRRIDFPTTTDPRADLRQELRLSLKKEAADKFGVSCFTSLSAYYDTDANDHNTESRIRNTTAILRLRWFHPFAGKCGMTISSVTAISDSVTGDTIPVSFLQKLQSLITNSVRPHSFCQFVENTLFQDHSESEFGIRMDLFTCFTALRNRRIVRKSNAGHWKISDLVGGKLLHRIATFISASGLAILEWKSCDTSDQVMYALGPADVEKDDCMIPLACFHWGQDDMVGKAWVRSGLYYWFENMVVVRPCDPAGEFRVTHRTQLPQMQLRSRMPRRGRFLGLCLAYFTHDDQPRSLSNKQTAKTIFQDSQEAATSSNPPPYVFDII